MLADWVMERLTVYNRYITTRLPCSEEGEPIKIRGILCNEHVVSNSLYNMFLVKYSNVTQF